MRSKHESDFVHCVETIWNNQHKDHGPLQRHSQRQPGFRQRLGEIHDGGTHPRGAGDRSLSRFPPVPCAGRGRGGVTFAVQYMARDAEAFEAYQRDCAPALQADHQAKWGSKAVAFRTVLPLIAEGHPTGGFEPHNNRFPTGIHLSPMHVRAKTPRPALPS